MKKYLIQNKISILLILLVSFITWFKILSRYPTGEGYFYFAQSNSINLKNISISSVLADYGILARLIFLVVIPIFKDNVPYYMYLQFFLMLATYFSFYFTFEKIFNNKIIGLTSTLLFITNYVGQFTMMGQGDYQRFIQRVPNLIPVFAALYFLNQYLEKGETKSLIKSILFYLFGVVLSHYNIFLSPIFIFLPIFDSLIRKKGAVVKMFLLSVIFAISPVFISKTDPLSHPTKSLISFITTTPDLIKMVLYQVPIVGIPVQVVQYFASNHRPGLQPPYTQIMPALLMIIVAIFIIGINRIKNDSKTLVFYLTFIFSLFTVSFLILYAYGTIPNPLTGYGEDRIYFIHSILFALIWTIILKTFVYVKHKNIYVVILVAVMVLNIISIWNDMDEIQIHSEIQRVYLSYIKKISPSFDNKTVIVVPSELLTSSVFIQRIYGIGNANMISLDDNWQKNVDAIKVNKKDVFIIDFSFKLNQDGNSDLKTVQIVDLTSNYRENKKIIPIKH